MRELLAVIKALADENRLRAVAALQGRELCLCQIVELLELATSTVSKHMSILQQARIVDSRKDGRWNYFRLAEESAPAAEATALVLSLMAEDKQIRADRRRLKEILKTSPEELCQRQNACK